MSETECHHMLCTTIDCDCFCHDDLSIGVGGTIPGMARVYQPPPEPESPPGSVET